MFPLDEEAGEGAGEKRTGKNSTLIYLGDGHPSSVEWWDLLRKKCPALGSLEASIVSSNDNHLHVRMCVYVCMYVCDNGGDYFLGLLIQISP